MFEEMFFGQPMSKTMGLNALKTELFEILHSITFETT